MKKILFEFSMIVLITVLTEILMVGVVAYYLSDWYVGLGYFMGMFITPLIAPVISLMIFLIIKKFFKGLSVGTLIITMGTVVVISEWLLVWSNSDVNVKTSFEHYLQSRSAYEQSGSHVSFLHATNQQMAEPIKHQLPFGWRLELVDSDSQEPNILWFIALEPSFRYGSIEHIGFYDKRSNKISKMTTIQDISKEVERREGSNNINYTNVDIGLFNRKIAFFTMTTYYYHITLSVEEDHIILKKIEKMEAEISS